MAKLRVKQDVAAIVLNPVTQTNEPLIPGKPYNTDNPDEDALIRAFPWAFESDVEEATAAPGRKRSVSRADK